MAKKRLNKSYTSPKAIRYFLFTYISVALLIVIQVIGIAFLSLALITRSANSSTITLVYLGFNLLSYIMVFFIINRNCNIAYKLAWVVPILMFPVAGGIIYLFVHSGQVHRIAKKRILKTKEHLNKVYFPDELPKKEECGSFERLPRYLEKEGFSSFKHSESQYFPSGETFFEDLKMELQKAKEFIFIEFFIIHEGIMWDSILTILKQKAKEGVKIRLIYDGMGSLKTVPHDYSKTLRSYGIDAKVFQPFVPLVSNMQNNRDHRKIVVIDGKTAFTGGINLSDEYINEYNRFGHWKDSGVKVVGDAAEQFTKFFLEMWYTNHRMDEDMSVYFGKNEEEPKGEGVMIPYCDTPILEHPIAKNIYLEFINNAKDYCYIATPYFIPGDDVMSALCKAARSGVDVRLITPFHGDKKAVHLISRSYYDVLLEAGARIYEYSPGFIHCKNFLADDRVASIGTTNLDYRSLYLNYECGLLTFNSKAVLQLKEDFLSTFEKCEEIHPNLRKMNKAEHFFISAARLFEPLI